MSSSTIYRVYGSKVRALGDLRNSWGTAPPLWDMLGYRFLGLDRPVLVAGPDAMQALWSLALNQRVPEHLRITFAFTLDRSVILQRDVKEAAKAFHATHAEILAEPPRQSRYSDEPTGPWTWTHWPAIAKAITSTKPLTHQVGWGLTCTSVSDVWNAWQEAKGQPAAFDALTYVRTCDTEAARV